MQQPRIVYFTKHTTAGPSSRYRSYAYHPFLQQHGFRISVYPLFPATYLRQFYATGKKPLAIVFTAYLRRLWQLVTLSRCDILFIEYELFPYTPLLVEKLLLRGKKNIVLDYDDAIFHNYDNSKNKSVRWLCGDKIYKLAGLAQLVITGSPYLTAQLSPYAKHIAEIPTSVTVSKYQSTGAASLPAEEKHEFRIGWIGSASTSVFVLSIAGSIAQFQQETGARLVLIGFDRKLEPLLGSLHYTLYDWSADNEIALLKTCDVGIMPLTDEPFNHGKCGFKLIQYMACGLPTISTPMEANVKINHEADNLFASTASEWLQCLRTIYHNREHFKMAGIKNEHVAKQYYSTEGNRQVYLSLFQKMAGTSL